MFLNEDYESIDEIALGEGFVIDDDGHWVPLDEAIGYGYIPEELELYAGMDDE